MTFYYPVECSAGIPRTKKTKKTGPADKKVRRRMLMIEVKKRGRGWTRMESNISKSLARKLKDGQ